MEIVDKTQLKQIVIDQQSEILTLNATNKQRNQSTILNQLINSSKLVKVVLGVRRAGKSSLCQSAISNQQFAYLNFDDERLIGISAADLQPLLTIFQELLPNTKLLFFDEIQNVSGWELFITRLQRNHYNVIITGSNGKLLGTDLATHLTGRQVSITLFPLSFDEFVQWRIPNETTTTTWAESSSEQKAVLGSLFNEYFQIGGFPEVALGEPQGIYLRELFDKIISRDIVQRYNLRELKTVKEIASYLIQNSAQLISYGNIQKFFNLKSITTTRKYVQLLKDVFMIHEIQGYSNKLRERSTSPRKVYACDLGMMRAMWTKPTLDLGSKLETLVLIQLLRRSQHVYYLKQNNREVDFCLLEDGKPRSLIQVCYNLSDQKTRERELRALYEASETYGIEDLSIVTREQEEVINYKGKKVKVLTIVEYLMMDTTSS